MADPLTVEDAMQSVLDSILGYHTSTLTKAWADAWDALGEDLRDTLTVLAADGPITPETLARSQRITQGLDATRDALDTLAALAGDTISEDVTRVLGLGADGEWAMIAAQLPEAIAPTRADQVQIEQLLTRSTQQITALTAPISSETDAAIRVELVRGIIAGDNPRQVADAMVARAGGAFTGGLTRALNISRTEMLDAMRSAQQITDQTNRGLLDGWVWSAHLGPRTCRSCIAMHGTVHPIEEDGPNDHQSGRCARVPKTKSWADLGFPDIPEPDLGLADADTWFDGLSDAEQQDILGKRGWQAWRRGDYPMDQWATLRENPDWRPSYVPSKPPKEP